MEKEITRIVITGGPGGGKSSALGAVREAFEPLGYKVLIIPESATELIGGGVAPWTCRTPYEYQLYQMELQLAKERIFQKAAQAMSAEKILILLDRGMADNLAYMTGEEYRRGLAAVGSTPLMARDSYDAVFHMTTAAKGGDGGNYSLANNAARTEDVPAAIEKDNRTLQAWIGHPHLRIIKPAASFKDKKEKLIREIKSYLGIPRPLEIERKYLIGYPDLSMLETLPDCRRINIEQVYLQRDRGMRRIRKRGEKGEYIYFYTEKYDSVGISRTELERKITREEYDALLSEADPERRPVIKDRYCIAYDNQYFELDVYPFWDRQAILEIELLDEQQTVTFPPYLDILQEVTQDKRYSNSALAKR